MNASRARVLVALSMVVALSLGCLTDPWRRALRDDSLVEYRRYLNKYPDSKHATDAQEHIAYHELKRGPNLGGYLRFLEEYPDTELGEDLRPEMEKAAFEVARFAGTPKAYTNFLMVFPDGANSERALGNMVYLEAGGFTTGVRSLEDFARDHPKSDYAAEARLSAEALRVRDTRHFEKVGLVIRIAPSVGNAQGVVDEFSRRAFDAYRRAGYTLVNVPQLRTSGRARDLPAARLVIEHREGEIKSKVTGGEFSRPGMLATTRVSLLAADGEEPIWQEEFKLRLDAQEHIAGSSVLFSPKSAPYWDAFFVPVASWPNQKAVRKPLQLGKKLVSVDSAGDRVVALHGDGNFELLELASTENALVLARYERKPDFTKWSGVRILGSRVMIFGQDGMEFVSFGSDGPRADAFIERQTIGAIYAVERMGNELLVASSRGLLILDDKGGQPRRLLRKTVRGLTVVGEKLVFSDLDTVYVSTLALLSQGKLMHQLKLGYDFAPKKLVSLGRTVVVLGKGGIVELELGHPKQPKMVSRLEGAKVGDVRDIAVMAGRVFVLTDRGLQLLDRDSDRIVEVVDVEARTQMSGMGRFLVVVGGEEIQVVDTAPFVAKLGSVAPRTKQSTAPASR